MNRTLIRKTSKKRSRQNRELSKLKVSFLTEHPLCARCGLVPATDIHHSANKEGLWLLLVRYWIGMCRLCHSACHNFQSHNPRFFTPIREAYRDHVKKLIDAGFSLDEPVFYTNQTN